MLEIVGAKAAPATVSALTAPPNQGSNKYCLWRSVAMHQRRRRPTAGQNRARNRAYAARGAVMQVAIAAVLDVDRRAAVSLRVSLRILRMRLCDHTSVRGHIVDFAHLLEPLRGVRAVVSSVPMDPHDYRPGARAALEAPSPICAAATEE